MLIINPHSGRGLSKTALGTIVSKLCDAEYTVTVYFSHLMPPEDIVFEHATAVKFLYDRIKFFRPDGTQGTQPRNGSMLIAYGEENAHILLNNRLKGKFLYLNNN